MRGAPYHPQTQGKIERWHQTLKNRILLENCYLPGDLERQIDAFVEHYNHVRYHESLSNLTPAILAARERIKRATIATRRLQHQLRKDFVTSIEYAAPLYFRSTVGDFVIALPSSRNCSFIFSICSFR